MSYDLAISVKVDGLDKYVDIAYPTCDHPTYNLGTMFRKCMDWDFSQSELGEDGKYHTCYYPCDDVIKYVEYGIRELRTNKSDYLKYNPENGWGSLDGALRTLESVRECIYETVEEKQIPIEYLYFSW